MLPHVFPGEVCSKPVDFSAVVADEKDEIFCREISSTTSIGESTGLYDLHTNQLNI